MKRIYYSAWRAMGCETSVQLETEEDGHAILRDIPARMEAIEARLSRFRPDSELMRFNARAGEWVIVSEVLFENLYAAKQAARQTDGAFNPLVLPSLIANGYDRTFMEVQRPVITSPVPAQSWRDLELQPRTRMARICADSAIDLGGIAKGWTAGRIADELKSHGACIVNIGGDVAARGAPEGYTGWEVQIADPLHATLLMTLRLRNASLMTSGVDYRHWTTAQGVQHHHIVDPRTGKSAKTDVLSVTVYHAAATIAEACTKAVILRGSEAGLLWLQAQWGAEGLVVRRDGAVLATPNFVTSLSERNPA